MGSSERKPASTSRSVGVSALTALMAALLAVPARLIAQEQPPPSGAAPAPPPSWVATSPVGAPKTFEVASVKLNKPGSLSGGMRLGPGSLTLTNTTLEWLVSWAYGIQDFQIVGAPRWFGSQTYDIAAKAYGAPDLAHLQLLLQPLLADRFKLTVHHEKRELAVYVLTVETRGLKIKASVGPASPDAPTLLGRNNGIGAQLTGQHATISQLTANLTRRLGRPVIDKTGLIGAFDFKLEWTPDENQVARTMPIGASSFRSARPFGPVHLYSREGTTGAPAGIAKRSG
jgi:uncharacterized protein (TIGR03435 family)